MAVRGWRHSNGRVCVRSGLLKPVEVADALANAIASVSANGPGRLSIQRRLILVDISLGQTNAHQRPR